MVDYTCIHEEQIQNQSRKIERIDAELNYKKEKLEYLQRSNERMEEKIDEIKESVNQIVLGSKKSDDLLDKRLLKIETRLETQEKLSKDNKDDFNLKLGVVTLIFIALTFYFNFIHHL